MASSHIASRVLAAIQDGQDLDAIPEVGTHEGRKTEIRARDARDMAMNELVRIGWEMADDGMFFSSLYGPIAPHFEDETQQSDKDAANVHVDADDYGSNASGHDSDADTTTSDTGSPSDDDRGRLVANSTFEWLNGHAVPYDASSIIESDEGTRDHIRNLVPVALAMRDLRTEMRGLKDRSREVARVLHQLTNPHALSIKKRKLQLRIGEIDRILNQLVDVQRLNEQHRDTQLRIAKIGQELCRLSENPLPGHGNDGQSGGDHVGGGGRAKRPHNADAEEGSGGAVEEDGSEDAGDGARLAKAPRIGDKMAG